MKIGSKVKCIGTGYFEEKLKGLAGTIVPQETKCFGSKYNVDFGFIHKEYERVKTFELNSWLIKVTDRNPWLSGCRAHEKWKEIIGPYKDGEIFLEEDKEEYNKHCWRDKLKKDLKYTVSNNGKVVTVTSQDFATFGPIWTIWDTDLELIP